MKTLGTKLCSHPSEYFIIIIIIIIISSIKFNLDGKAISLEIASIHISVIIGIKIKN